jgi:hypothetical protein
VLLTPALGLSVLLALLYTLAVHLLLGLGYRGLLWHWLLALAGMAAGYALASRSQSHLPTLGDLHVIEASAAGLALLLIAGLKVRLAGSQRSPGDRE